MSRSDTIHRLRTTLRRLENDSWNELSVRVDDLEACPGSDIPCTSRKHYLEQVNQTLADIHNVKLLRRVLPHRVPQKLRAAIDAEHDDAAPMPELMPQQHLARSMSRLVRCFHGSMEQVQQSLESLLKSHTINRIEHINVVPTDQQQILMTVVAIELRAATGNADDVT